MNSYHRLSENKGNPNPFRLEKLQFFLAENLDIFFAESTLGLTVPGLTRLATSILITLLRCSLER